MMARPVDIIFPARQKLKEQGKCPSCSKPVGKFRDELSEKEFHISGMCQGCQDNIFGPGE